MEKGLNERVIDLEAFVNEKLRNDLKRITEARDQINQQISEYSNLKSTIESLRVSGMKEDLKTRMDIGCNFYMEAVVRDPSRVLVAIGHGFFVEMTYEEALAFIEKKTVALEQRATSLSNEANCVKARIKLMQEGLREVQNIPPGR